MVSVLEQAGRRRSSPPCCVVQTAAAIRCLGHPDTVITGLTVGSATMQSRLRTQCGIWLSNGVAVTLRRRSKTSRQGFLMTDVTQILNAIEQGKLHAAEDL